MRAALAAHERVKAQRAHLRRLEAATDAPVTHAAVRLRVRARAHPLRAARRRARASGARAPPLPGRPPGLARSSRCCSGAVAASPGDRRRRVSRPGRGVARAAGRPIVGAVGVPRAALARWRWDIGDDGHRHPHGTFTIRRTLIPWVRVQHVDTRRGIFEQLFGLATVIVHTAAGAHTIPLLDAGEADELRDAHRRPRARRGGRAGADELEATSSLTAAAAPRGDRSSTRPSALRNVRVPAARDRRDVAARRRRRHRAACCGRRSTAAIGLAISVASGFVRWRTTTLLDRRRRRSTTTPACCASRTRRCRSSAIEALDVHQGPLQRAVRRARRSTSRPARRQGRRDLAARRSRRTRSRSCARRGRGAAAAAAAAEAEPPRRPRRLAGRELAIAALTAGQLGIVLPVLAAAGQVAAAVSNDDARARQERAALPALRDRGRADRARRCSCVAWLLSDARRRSSPSPASRSPATATACASAAGSCQRSEATVPVGRVRAVRVVEGHLPAAVRARGADRRGHRLRRGGRPPPARCSRSCGCATSRRSWTSSCPSSPTTRAGCAPAAPPGRAPLPAAADAGRAGRRRGAWFAVGAVRRCSPRCSGCATAGPRWRAAGLAPRATAGSPSAAPRLARDDGPRPGALPRVPHAHPEPLPAPRATSPTCTSRSASARRPASATSRPADARGGLARRSGDAEPVQQRVVGAPGAAHAHGEVQVDVLGRARARSPCGRPCRSP